MSDLHPHEIKILKVLIKKSTPEEISKSANLPVDAVMRASSWLATKNLVKVDETVYEEVTLGDEGREYATKGLPERRIIDAIRNEAALGQLKLDKKIVSIGLGWLRQKKLASFEGGKIKVIRREKTPDELVLELLSRKGNVKSGELSGNLKDGLELLKKRQNIVKISVKKSIVLVPTDAGAKLGKTVEDSGVSQLTSRMLTTGEWKSKKFRPYDINIYVKPQKPAKKHPLRQAIDRVRDIFVRLGFREVKGNLVESAFWNFDVLFQPQDHPARDMHDTFYLKTPGSIEIPRFKELRDKVKAVHENGWTTGSTGWEYDWDEKIAQKTLLRTHTTAVTAYALANIRKDELPAKVFSIGKTFRNEKMDYKHLVEFNQVEGIVVDENATFRDLLGILKRFYDEMGFERVRFRPGYFPYTEMSVEPEVYFEDKDEWIELGGAGIFRPEVVKPLLGFDCHVLAWGLGLDRVVALRMGLKDIRDLYMSDLDWLRNSKVT